jgi:hypothetical protein
MSGWLQELHKKYPDGLPLLDPVDDMGVREASVQEAIADIKRMEAILQMNEVAQVNHFPLLLECLYRAWIHSRHPSKRTAVPDPGLSRR